VSHTASLAGLRRADEPRFGGKSVSLGELIAGDIPVPPGFAVASTAFAGPPPVTIDPDDLEELRDTSAAMVEAVRAAPVPDDVRQEVTQRYEELAAAAGDAEPPVAVRSSALGEDSADATFAGQQETYLWVRGADDVCRAMRDCWASLYTPEAMSYRARVGGAGAPAMGVAVQLMVDAAVSGVMFTCNPVSGDPSTVAVNASWGLGTAVVGGEVTPDEYRLSKVTGEVLHRSVGPKRIEYVGPARREVPVERQEVACLGEDRLGLLLEVARRVERHFGSHQDIEWALARDGSLFVLQSRPVTAARKREPGPARSAMDYVMGTFGARPDRG
jgi:pyruvate,water dikinase